MKCAINQPTFIPWLGYFELIDKADYFVFLDDVQLSKPSWQVRNKILVEEGSPFVSLPIKRTTLDQKINQTYIIKNRDFKKVFNKIDQSYKKCPFYSEIMDLIFNPIIQFNKNESERLDNFNINIIKNICNYLEIQSKFLLASSIQTEKGKVDRLISICKNLNCNEYISPKGAEEYLNKELDKFYNANIKVGIQSYCHPVYKQKANLNQDFLSIIDLLFMHGKESSKIFKKGFNYLRWL